MSSYACYHRKPKTYLQQIEVIQNCRSDLAFTADVDQTGGQLGLLYDSTSSVLAFGQLASAVRGIPVSVGSSLQLLGAHTVSGACPVSGSAPLKMIVSETDFLTDYYYYYGGLIGESWKINRFTKGDVSIKRSANVDNNPSYTNFVSAWAARDTLTYGVL